MCSVFNKVQYEHEDEDETTAPTCSTEPALSLTIASVAAAVTQQTGRWSEQDLQALPDNGYIHEVVNGELIMSPKNSFEHGDICIRLATALNTHARSHRLGVVLDSSTGFWMSNRNCRAPDISFISKERLKGVKRPPKAFFQGAPDLAVEIVAPSNAPMELSARLQDYFSSGTQLAWLIHPDQKFVEVCHSAIDRRLLGVGALLDGENLLPGFRFPIDRTPFVVRALACFYHVRIPELSSQAKARTTNGMLSRGSKASRDDWPLIWSNH